MAETEVVVQPGNGSGAAAVNRHQRRAAAADKRAAKIVVLGGRDYEIPSRFNIGELKLMTAVVDSSDNVVERSKLLVSIALTRNHPDVTLDDDFETDMAELNSAAAAVIDIAGFVMVGKTKAAPATA